MKISSKNSLFGLLVAAAASSPVLAADTATVLVNATVTGTCLFDSNGSVNFGNLDPAIASDVIGSVTRQQFWCTNGTPYTITDNGGLNSSGGTYRMVHALDNTAFIPYSFNYTATGTGTGKTTPIIMNISAIVAYADFADALAGSYSDTVTLTITP